jgi:steroid delta-isomerase-like uncharacterized protein
MSAVDNKNLNDRWIQAFNERDWSTEKDCRGDNFRAHVSGGAPPLDSAGWEGFLRLFTTAFPDARIEVQSSISEGDLVASLWIIRGTHRGEFQGVPASGRPIEMPGVDFSRIVDGKIVEHWAQFDVMGLMRQIGAAPPAS